MAIKRSFFKSWSLAILVCLLTFNGTYGQDSIPGIKVSKDKVFIDGKLFYIHIVEKGQTIYSICRAYGVSEADVAAENISVMYGPLQVGQALKIPVYERRSDKKDKSITKDFIEHKVRPRQTLFFLSRKYRIPVDTIVKYNPSTATGAIQINQIIRIPRDAINSIKKTDEEKQREIIVHKVEAGETLSALQRKYQISIDEIVSANPQLVDGLKAGMDLKIPLIEGTLAQQPQDSLTLMIDSLEMMQHIADTFGRKPVIFNCGQEWDRFKTYKMALLLPFQVNNPLPDSLISENTISKYITREKRNEIYFEFYEGVLFAIDSLKNLGMKTKLYVYDTEGSPVKVHSIIRELIHIHPDLIIGPVFKEVLREVSEFALLNEIPIVSPISQDRKTLLSNPYFFQVIPSFETEVEKFSQYISRLDYQYKNIIFINSCDSIFIQDINYFKDRLYESLEKGLNFGNFTFKELILRKEELYTTNRLLTLKPKLIQSFATDTPNLIVFSPELQQSYVSNLMDIFNLFPEYNIEVFGFPEWQRFDNIEQEYFHNLRVKLHTPFHYDMKDKNTQLFLTKYQNQFKNIPVRFTRLGYNFTLLGYDIGFYFGNALRIFGNQFPGCLEYYNPDLLLSDYKFKRKDVYSGFSNTTIQILEFKDEFETSSFIIE